MSTYTDSSFRYPGSRPFYDTINDQRLFFGRDKDVQLLLYETLTTNLVILYAKSGLGKTSLLNAGLYPALRDRGFIPFKARFNNKDIEPLQAVFEGIKEMEQNHPDYDEGKKDSLWEFFKTAAFWGPGNKLLTPVLIMDQFEDFFDSYTHSLEERKKFYRHLAYLVSNIIPPELLAGWDTKEGPFPYSDNPPNIKVIISIREDYLCQLEEMHEDIPGILHRRLRLLPLSREQARQAILKPTKVKVQANGAAPLEFSSDAVKDMLEFLCKTKTKDTSQVTQDVEPFELQLLCRHLEEKARQKPGEKKGKVEKADLGEESGMKKVLQNYYEDRLKEIGPVWKKRRVRKLFTKGLITPSNRRSFLGEEDIKNRFKIKKGLLEALVNNRLLRAEPRLGTPYYELSHDSLIEPIRNSQKKSRSRKLWMAIGIGFLFILFIIAYFSPFKKEKEPFIYSLSQTIPISQTRPGKDKIEVVDIDPEGAVIYYYIGCTHYFKGDFKKAVENFNEAKKIDPAFVYAYNGLGLISYKQEKYHEAIEYYKDAIKIRQDYPYAYSNLGVALIKIGSDKQAIENFKKAIKIKKDYLDAYINWGNALTAQKKYTQAIEIFNRAIGIDPGYVYAYSGLGITLYEMGNYDEAIKYYKKTIEIDPGFADAYFNLGMTLYEVKKYDEAIKYYNKAIDIDPGFADAYYEIGIVLHNQKKEYNQAIEKFNKVIKLEPLYAAAYFSRGNSFYYLKKYSESIESLKKAVEIDPNPDHKTGFVEINLLTGHFEEAFSLAKKYLREKSIPLQNRLVMELIVITSLLSRGKQPDAAECDKLINDYQSFLEEATKIDWGFNEIKEFINNAKNNQLTIEQARGLFKLIDILEKSKKVQEKELKELCELFRTF
jgi:superkiller protein 3